jgi:tetratricopeptide (TPR) repeat protein
MKVWRPVIVAVAVALVLGGGAAIAWFLGHQSNADTITDEVRTTPIVRESLQAGFKLNGQLGYGDIMSLATASSAVITKLPEAGQMIDTGQVIMEIEGSPVFLLQGDLPLWRDLKPGVTGKDVANLREALQKIGIDAGEGQTYDAALSGAITALYRNAGYAEPVAMAEDKAQQETAKEALDEAKATLTEAQEALTKAKNAKPDEATVIRAQASVDAARAAYEDALNGDCTSLGAIACTETVLTAAKANLDLAIAEQNALNEAPDTSAQQKLVDNAQKAVDKAQEAYDETLQNSVGPKNILIVPESNIRIDEVTATVGEPATGEILTYTRTVLYASAELTSAQERMLDTGQAATITLRDGTEVAGTIAKITEARTDASTWTSYPASVRVDIDDQAALAELGPSAVTISFVTQTVEDTLIVPVTALIVPAEGGWCVKLADGRYVRVEVGLIADTRAQIFSDELTEGDLVVVP